jgi:hypothetical protein
MSARYKPQHQSKTFWLAKQETIMKTISHTRKFLTVAFAIAALAAGVLSVTTSADAKYWCHWTPGGTVCTWTP